ncbi:uncharacterized protein METZ01_LOCUS204125, partial [marine metagenome]
MLYCLHNVIVSRTATEISFYRVPYFSFRRFGIAFQQLPRRQDHAGSAES